MLIVACPSSGTIICSSAATMMTPILAGPFRLVPCSENSKMTVATTKKMPSISKPTWVIQLNSATSRFPFWPNGARLTMNAVVPVFGPCRLANPSSA